MTQKKIVIDSGSWHYRLYCRPAILMGTSAERIVKPTNLCEYVRSLFLSVLQWTFIMLCVTFWKLCLRPVLWILWYILWVPFVFLIYCVLCFGFWVEGKVVKLGFWKAFRDEWLKFEEPKTEWYETYKAVPGFGDTYPKEILIMCAIFGFLSLVAVAFLGFMIWLVHGAWGILPQTYTEKPGSVLASIVHLVTIGLAIYLAVRWKKHIAEGWKLAKEWIKAKKANICPLIEVRLS